MAGKSGSFCFISASESKPFLTSYNILGSYFFINCPTRFVGSCHYARTFATRKRSSSTPAALYRVSLNRPKKRKGLQEESMTAALKAVVEGQSLSQAACDHRMPRTTLYDQVSGRVTHGSKPGPQQYLKCEEERELRN